MKSFWTIACVLLLASPALADHHGHGDHNHDHGSHQAGGDMGAHVWGPAFLRDELLPRLRLTGWTPDWYSGFPAFQDFNLIRFQGHCRVYIVRVRHYLKPYGIGTGAILLRESDHAQAL